MRQETKQCNATKPEYLGGYFKNILFYNISVRTKNREKSDGEGGEAIHLTLVLCIFTELEKVPGDEK